MAVVLELVLCSSYHDDYPQLALSVLRFRYRVNMLTVVSQLSYTPQTVISLWYWHPFVVGSLFCCLFYQVFELHDGFT